ncbi:vacuolar membrane protein-domain-containing protein [Phycomyces nitens]|nr:vacuolar membrane protein-domain-containing protein [Phycomyces nitens]
MFITPCQGNPPKDIPPFEDDEGCKLLDSFAIVVQFTLAATALLTLFIKRYRERPQRPVPVWALDISKQFVGAVVIHFLNLATSYLAGRPKDGQKTNLCVWYFLNVAIDTTLGVAILWAWLHIIQYGLERLNVKDIRSGYYGPPPLRRRLLPWIKQTTVFVIAESLMKLCVYGMFRAFPSLFDLGEWVLQWTRDNYRYQVVFVMLVFPLIMNAVQFWVVDTIVKVHPLPLGSPDTIKGIEVAPSPYTPSRPLDKRQQDIQNEHTPLLKKASSQDSLV